MKSYLKNNWLFLLLIVGTLVFCYIKRGVADGIVLGSLLTVSAIENYKKNKSRRAYLAELEEMGLTEEIAEQTNFVQEWQLVVKKGIVYYCLIYKGLPLTIYFTLFLFILSIIMSGLLSASLHTQEIFIGSIVSGFFLAVAASKYLWSANQRKFARLNNRAREIV